MAFRVGIDIFVQVWPLYTAHCLTGASLLPAFLTRNLWMWIRIRSDQNLLAGSGSEKHHSGSGQLRIRNEFEVKNNLKILQFPNKNVQ
jgi:hypothetical protein